MGLIILLPLLPADFVLEPLGQFVFGGQIQLVFLHEKRFFDSRGCIFHQFLACLGAHQNAYRRIVAFFHYVLTVVSQVQVHLRNVVVLDFVCLEVNQHVALENPVVKDQIAEEVVVIDKDSLLPGFETEAVAEFQQEFFKVVHQRVFQVGFFDNVLVLEPDEFIDVRALHDILELQRMA